MRRHTLLARARTEDYDSRNRREHQSVGVQLVARVVATLTSIDLQLERSIVQLDQLRATTVAAATAQQWMGNFTRIATLALAWLAAGQGALC